MIQKYNLPGYAVGVASKGCVTFATEKIADYTTFKRSQDKDLSELAWLFNMNRGIFMTPGREEEWTLSVTHTDESRRRVRRGLRRDGGGADLLSGKRLARVAAGDPRDPLAVGPRVGGP